MNLGPSFFVMLVVVLAGAILLGGWRGLVIALVAGAIGLVRGAMFRRSPTANSGVAPHLLPDPALGWLLGAREALGAWVAEAPEDTEGALQWRRVLAEGRLTSAQIEVVEQRLRRASEQAGSGAERLEFGTLLFGTATGAGAGILLPPDASKRRMEEGSEDVMHLLKGLGRRPLVERMTREQDQPTESVGSIGLRLAYQLERILNAEVVVVAQDRGNIRVIGTSGQADRRLLETIAVPGSPLFQVAFGEVPSFTTIADPLGGTVPDRRSRFSPAIVLPIKNGEESVGAVAFWTADEAEPIGPVIAEVNEVMRNAGPRIVRALKMAELGEAASQDSLTGLKNRRGLDEAMHQFGQRQGALIYADFDKFKLLNDTLGHPAGDAALVHFARLVHQQIRGGDTAARIGGEEFALWLPGTTLAWGVGVAERIRVKLGTTHWDWQGRSWPLSASFGIAAVPETSQSIENLPGQADAALLLAKKDGRNRVEVARRLDARRSSGAVGAT